MTPLHLHGKIADIDAHTALNPHFAKAFAFLKRPDLARIPLGRYELDGADCYAMVQEATLRHPADAKCEAHGAFVDIQTPLSGPETFGLAETPDAALAGAFADGKDIVFFEAPQTYLTLRPGEYAIFFPPKGGHTPCLTDGDVAPIRKVVIKVRA